ncbi:MAG TPA: N-acetylglucosamine-6-phosphate deacetylase [Kineosporiaceae bacterium]
MPVTITAPRLLTGRLDHAPGWVRLNGGTVVTAGPGAPPEPADLELPTGVLAPGLVDAQLNGAFGVDVAGAEEDAWAAMLRRLPTTGVTAVVPTVITAPLPALLADLHRSRRVRARLAAERGLARALPLHVEGPFLAERRRGAHPLEHLIDPTPAAVDALLAAGADGALGYLTLAPERAGALAAVRRLVEAGVSVSVGHSDADQATVHAAADAGATLVTHLFNAQRPLGHRDPGVVGAALVDDRLTCGLIVDGDHVLPAAVRVAFSCKPEQIMLVTDAMAALGMPPGRYLLGGREVVVRAGGPPRLPDGTLAGAAGRLDDAIGLTVAAGVGLQQAVEAATRVPADALRQSHLGRLEPGCAADLVWLAADGDHPLRARATWIGGVVAHDDGLPVAAPPTPVKER